MDMIEMEPNGKYTGAIIDTHSIVYKFKEAHNVAGASKYIFLLGVKRYTLDLWQ